nr:RNA polymerase sigma factor [Micromonospora sp. DSM 115978]
MSPAVPTSPRDGEVEPLEHLVSAAQDGDTAALERLVRAVHERVYRLALRMTSRPPDAEDATQEILLKLVSRLSTYRGEAAFTTWVHRLAVNHLLDRRKSCVERMEFSFDRFAEDLLDGLSAGPSAAPDAALLEREVQLACTHAVLACLDRDHRIAYILGEILEVDSTDGGYVCDVSPATFRKRLSRARGRVRRHLAAHCGLVNTDAPCHCSKRVDTAVRTGRVTPGRLEFVDISTGASTTGAPRENTTEATNSTGGEQTVAANEQIARLYDAGQLLRSLPPAAVPETTRQQIASLLAATGLG